MALGEKDEILDQEDLNNLNNLFGYYLYELVDRNLVRNGNNNILKKCDELWVYGEISDGVLAEIQMFKKLKDPSGFLMFQIYLKKFLKMN